MFGVSSVFFQGMRLVAGDAVEEAERIGRRRPEEDDVVLVAELGVVAEDVDRDVIVGDAALVEGDPDPAFGLGVLPGVDERDARHDELVRREVGEGGHGEDGQAVGLAGGVERPLEVARILAGLDDERPGPELLPQDLEVLFGRVDLELLLLEAERGQGVVGVVVDEIGLDRALAQPGDPAGRGDLAFDERHGRVEDGDVVDADGLDVVERPERPADVVVRPGVVDVEVLAVEHHVGHARIGLVHADDVAPGRVFGVLDLEGLVGPMDLDALGLELAQEPGRLAGARVVAGEDVGRGALGPGLGHGALALEVEVLQELVLERRDVVHADEDAALLEVDVVADGPERRAQGRVGPVPGPVARGRDDPGRAVARALGLVEAADGVVAVGRVEGVVRGPAVVEGVGPDARARPPWSSRRPRGRPGGATRR